MTIVGSGAIGVEWASMYRDFGSEVHLVEFLDRVVPLEEPDVSKELNRVFKRRGITIYTASTIATDSIERTEGGLKFAVTPNEGDGRTEVETDVILVAVGRRPLTDGIGLENIPGVELERGYVKVDEYMRTGVEHLYAIGDIVPGFQLAHVASHEAVVAVEKIAGHDPEPVRMDLDAARHVLPAADRQRRNRRAAGTGAGPRSQGRFVPVPRPGQGDDRRRESTASPR